MSDTAAGTTPTDRITLGPGESAAVPVPEGRLVLRSDGDGRQSVVVLEPHGGAPGHEVARFVLGSYDPTQMITVALAALDSWR